MSADPARPVAGSGWTADDAPQLFRAINDRIRRIAVGVDAKVAFVCECGDYACTTNVQMSLDEYDAACTHTSAWTLAPDHEPGDADVVAHTDRYLLVRRKPES